MFRNTPFGVHSSISKPLSAIIESPSNKSSKIPQCSVACLSLVRPTYKSDTNETEPAGVIPMSALAVLKCL